MQIGLPLLASESKLGAVALGALAATYGAGALCGSLLAGALPNWRIGTLGITMLCLDLGIAVFLFPVGLLGTTWPGLASLFGVGVMSGYGQLISLSWVQQRAPKKLLGRVMSLYLAIVTSVAPLSAVVAGWLLSVTSAPTVFIGAALCVATAANGALYFTRMRKVSDPKPR
jgi:predicted MFS family arabinose efflux permease